MLFEMSDLDDKISVIVFCVLYLLIINPKAFHPQLAESESLELGPGDLNFKHTSLLIIIYQSEFYSSLY